MQPDPSWATINEELTREYGPFPGQHPPPAPHPWRAGVVRLRRIDARRIGRDLRQG